LGDIAINDAASYERKRSNTLPLPNAELLQNINGAFADTWAEYANDLPRVAFEATIVGALLSIKVNREYN
jgi:hypothetical protein